MIIDFLFYLLKVSGVFIIFYLAYVLLFRRLTFHSLNRGFLMAVLPLSLIIPIINCGHIPNFSVTNTELPLIFNDFGERSNNAVLTHTASPLQWNMLNISLLVYVSFTFFYLLNLGLNIVKLVKTKRRSFTHFDGKFYIITAKVPAVYSFFNWIFLPIHNANKIDKAIIEHEKLHARAYHTLDLIATELFVAFFWFNPFVYLFRRDLKSVHEYQIDGLIQKAQIKTSDYLRMILNDLERTVKTAAICNSFNGSSIEKRIQMMTKSKSPKWQTGRYLFLIPLMALIMMTFSANTPTKNNMPDISPIKVGNYENISSGYGMRIHPITKEKRFHRAIDFAAQTGTPIIATANGIVTRVVFLKDSHGKLVDIDHGNGFATRYTQMSDFAVKEGDKVKKGDVVGYVGQSGISTGPHLHYEVLKDGKNVNPQEYINDLR